MALNEISENRNGLYQVNTAGRTSDRFSPVLQHEGECCRVTKSFCHVCVRI